MKCLLCIKQSTESWKLLTWMSPSVLWLAHICGICVSAGSFRFKQFSEHGFRLRTDCQQPKVNDRQSQSQCLDSEQSCHIYNQFSLSKNFSLKKKRNTIVLWTGLCLPLPLFFLLMKLHKHQDQKRWHSKFCGTASCYYNTTIHADIIMFLW